MNKCYMPIQKDSFHSESADMCTIAVQYSLKKLDFFARSCISAKGCHSDEGWCFWRCYFGRDRLEFPKIRNGSTS